MERYGGQDAGMIHKHDQRHYMTTTRVQKEQDITIEQLTVKIEKMRADLRWEAKKFILQAIIASAALMSAGAALAVLFMRLAGRG